MKLGDVGNRVKDLQNYLISKGFLEESEYNYGPKTKRAVMKLQEVLGYRQTGVWREDLELLEELINQPEIKVRLAKVFPRFGLNNVLDFAGKVFPSIGDTVEIIKDGCYGGTASDAGQDIPEILKGVEFNVIKENPKANQLLLDKIYSWVPSDILYTVSDVWDAAHDTGILESLGIKSSIVTKETNQVTKTKATLPFAVDLIPCYVINLNTQSRTEFYISPESVSDSMSASFEDQVTKSRTTPYKAYSNSGPREVSFSVQISADYCPEGIVPTVRKLQALTLPAKTGGYVSAPSCYVRIGDFIAITGVCLSVGVEWQKPYKDGIYTIAEVSFSFNEVQDSSVYTDQWEQLSV